MSIVRPVHRIVPRKQSFLVRQIKTQMKGFGIRIYLCRNLWKQIVYRSNKVYFFAAVLTQCQNKKLGKHIEER